MVIATLGASFLFLFASAILVLGVGTSVSQIACEVGIWWCILLYAASKVLIYGFLMERVYLVNAQTPRGRVSRVQSKWYRASSVFFGLWLGVAVTLIVGRIAKIRENDEACIIGLKLFATIPMLVVDLAVNVFLTSAFIIPLRKSSFQKARRLARNSVVAAIAALVTSAANFIILSVQRGEQLSWVCLGSCGLDVFANASIIFFITSIREEAEFDTQAHSNANGFSRQATRKGSLVPPMGASRVQFSRAGNSDLGITVVEEVCYDEDRAEDEPLPPRGYRNPAQRSVVVQLDRLGSNKADGLDDDEDKLTSEKGSPTNLV